MNNNSLYEDYKQTLIDNLIQRVEKELNKRKISQLEVMIRIKGVKVE